MSEHQSIPKPEEAKKVTSELGSNETATSFEGASYDFGPGVMAFKSLQAAADDSPRSNSITQLQAKADDAANNDSNGILQLQAMADARATTLTEPIQRQENKTGLPDNLKSGMENLSGYSMDDVKVHRNSAKPAQLQAHAYAQGTDIHLGPGQEKHLPHELGHVVQQKQGRVKPTTQLKGKVNINDDAGLEKEADVLGAKALQAKFITSSTSQKAGNNLSNNAPVQREPAADKEKNAAELFSELPFGETALNSDPSILAYELTLEEKYQNAIKEGEIKYWAIDSDTPKYNVPSDKSGIFEYGTAQEAFAHFEKSKLSGFDDYAENVKLERYIDKFDKFLDLIIDIQFKDTLNKLDVNQKLQMLEKASLALNVTGAILGTATIFSFSSVTAGVPLLALAAAGMGSDMAAHAASQGATIAVDVAKGMAGVGTNMYTGLASSGVGLAIDAGKNKVKGEKPDLNPRNDIALNATGNGLLPTKPRGKKLGMEGGASKLGGVLAGTVGALLSIGAIRENFKEWKSLEKARKEFGVFLTDLKNEIGRVGGQIKIKEIDFRKRWSTNIGGGALEEGQFQILDSKFKNIDAKVGTAIVAMGIKISEINTPKGWIKSK